MTLGTAARFLVVLLALLGSCWAIVGATIVPWLTGGWETIGLLALALTAIPLAIFIGVRALGGYAGRFVRLAVFRPFWYTQLLLIASAIAAAVGGLAGLPFGAAGTLARVFVLLALALGAVAILAGYLGARRLMVRTLEVRHPSLPAAFDGFRVVQVSDLHVGPHSRRAEQRAIARAVREARPDTVVVTGDLVDDFPRDVARIAELLPDFDAPAGVFVVPGNHDIYAGWNAVAVELGRLPVTVLVNEWRAIEREGARLTVIGTGDPAAGASGESALGAVNLRAALAGASGAGFRLALAHNPALWRRLADAGVHLTLSGHTHWGQFAIPSRNWSIASVFLEHAMGWHRRGDSLLWINPGTSYWGIPFRIGALAEVTVLVLRTAVGTPSIAQCEYRAAIGSPS